MYLNDNVKLVMSYQDRCRIVANLWRNVIEMRDINNTDLSILDNDCMVWEVSKIDVLQYI